MIYLRGILDRGKTFGKIWDMDPQKPMQTTGKTCMTSTIKL